MLFNSSIDSFTLRKSFKSDKNIVPVPNLIEIQSKSFNDLIQLDCLPTERKNIGLEKAFRDIFPIEHNNKIALEYLGYELGNWECFCGALKGLNNRYKWKSTKNSQTGFSKLGKDDKEKEYILCKICESRVELKPPFTALDCKYNEHTYAFQLKVNLRLVSFTLDANGEKIINEIKEQSVYFGELPIMIDVFKKNDVYEAGNQGIFLINGIDRVVVSQLQRSPGAVFSKSKKTKDLHGQFYYIARIIPMRGSWIDFEFDTNELLCVKIDKKKKIFVTTFLQAFGLEKKNILPTFYDSDLIYSKNGIFYKKVDDSLIGFRIKSEMLPKILEDKFIGRRITKELVKDLLDLKIKTIELPESYILNKILRSDLIDKKTGEIYLQQGETITQNNLNSFKTEIELSIDLLDLKGMNFEPSLVAVLKNDSTNSCNEAIYDIHSKVWPGESISLEESKQKLYNQFFSSKFYDLTKVGRIRLNEKLNLKTDTNITVLNFEDIKSVIKYLINLKEFGIGELDDIDHLGNRRVRLVGELLSNQIYNGLIRINKIVKERFINRDLQTSLMPQDFINIKPLSSIIHNFFSVGQLSQFMDQTNPLAEISHKRRMSALGPGGILKDRATYEVRDVHTSHYGRICPIETPEGQTIGLISSLATYAMVNDLGFIESAYRPVENGKIKDEVVFLNAFEESKYFIAQADSVDNNKQTLNSSRVLSRKEGNFMFVDANDVNFIDLSPKQLVSVAAALIPFLEHDDASRALMGANMQRQAIPVILPQVPIVGTGMERNVALSSNSAIIADCNGTVNYVDSEKIIVTLDSKDFKDEKNWLNDGVKIYDLKKFARSSYSTWVHQRPIVKKGQKVVIGDFLTDGTSVKNGELALGSNLTVAFMPWNGYNFEDAIVVSNRLVADNTFTSLTIEEYDVEARDTKLGPEEITRDIPNVSDDALNALDEHGIIKIGSRVKPGDILVGKVTLKGDVQHSPEEKLLRAVFGEKSREVRDTSLRVQPGVEGTVTDIKIFSRSGVKKDKRYKENIFAKIDKLELSYEKQIHCLKKIVKEKCISILSNKEAVQNKENSKLLKNKEFDNSLLKNCNLEDLFNLKAKDSIVENELKKLAELFEKQLKIIEVTKNEKIAFLKKGDVLPSGVIKTIKIFITSKRQLSVGDKIAGRHGNKGVVSTILPIEDMPFLDDGRTIDVILNPLGVPSRMNVGQILETILGYTGKILGEKAKDLLNDKSYEVQKNFLIAAYGNETITEFEAAYGKNGIKELLEKTSIEGVCYKSAVFEGANLETNIQPLLRELKLSESGAFKIRDGQTGEYFYQNVTVGVIYMLKLNHMADDKLHARSIGPYSLITQQPLGGKAKGGGQRFGEMEVWALEAYGAAYTLQELLTYKSDDVIGRHKVYENTIRGFSIPDPGIPESFNVLIKELQSLSLQVDLLKIDKEDIGE